MFGKHAFIHDHVVENLNEVTTVDPIDVKFGLWRIGAYIDPTIWFHAFDVTSDLRTRFQNDVSIFPSLSLLEQNIEPKIFDLFADL